MSIDQVVSLISSGGTFISTIIILFTLLEMGKQRRSAYKPDLILAKQRFYIYQSQKETPFIWSTELLNEKEVEQHKKQMHIKAFNIGMGGAKSVEISYTFDVKLLLDMIKELDKDEHFSIEYDQEHKYKFIYSKSLGVILHKSDLSFSTDYLLATSVEKEPLEVRLPISYLLLISIVYYLGMKDWGKFIPPDIPPLKVKASYFDIGDNKHIKDFQLYIKPYAFRQTSQENQLTIDGYFDTTKD